MAETIFVFACFSDLNGPRSRNAIAASVVPAHVLKSFSDLPAGDATQILVDITGIDRLTPTSVIQILKELLAGELLASLDDSCDAAIHDRYGMRNSALATKLETKIRAGDCHVSTTERREAKRSVVSSV